MVFPAFYIETAQPGARFWRSELCDGETTVAIGPDRRYRFEATHDALEMFHADCYNRRTLRVAYVRQFIVTAPGRAETTGPAETIRTDA